MQNECSIIYTDFINDIGPIMSKLEEQGITSVAYVTGFWKTLRMGFFFRKLSLMHG